VPSILGCPPSLFRAYVQYMYHHHLLKGEILIIRILSCKIIKWIGMVEMVTPYIRVFVYLCFSQLISENFQVDKNTGVNTFNLLFFVTRCFALVC